jgi:hypothetical protein
VNSIVFHPLAEQELMDAATYHEQQRLGLGLEYLGEVEHAVNFLSRYPEAGSEVRGFVRPDATKVSLLVVVSCVRRGSDSYFSSDTSQA